MSKRDELIQLYSEIPGKMITFDLTGRCNLKCVMCVWHNGKMKDQKKEAMSFDSLKSVVNQALTNKIKFSCINLSVSGEPFLHPEIDKIISYFFDNNEKFRLFDCLSINTNVTPIAPKILDFILEKMKERPHGQLFLTCSLNSATRETGVEVKGGDFHEIIDSRMREIIEKKAKFGFKGRLKLDLQMLVLKETEDEVGVFVDKWSKVFLKNGLKYRVVADEFCDDDNVINIKREFDSSRQVECDKRFQKAVRKLNLKEKEIVNFYEDTISPDQFLGEVKDEGEKIRKPCHALWQTPIVRSDGRISVCLSDIDGHMDIGNLGKSDFLSIWLGKAANDYRILHSMNKANNIGVCNHCTYYEAGQVEKKYWDRYLEIMAADFAEKKDRQVRIQKFNSLPNKLLTIDISNACNLYCFYCTFTQEDVHSSKKKKFMSVDDIKKICSDFLAHGTKFECIVLSVSGEPTLNPHFSSIMEYLFEMNGVNNRFFKYISINTNVTFLDKPKVDLITKYIGLGYGQLQLTLSINSASRESFIKTKKVDLFDKTIENTIYLLAEKARLNLTWKLNVYLLFLVNEMVVHEAEEFKVFWESKLKELGLIFSVDYALPVQADTSIIFKRTYANEVIFNSTQSEYDQMHQSVAEGLGLRPQDEAVDLSKNVPVFVDTKKKCASPWISPVIRHDGTLSFCLQDTHNAMPIGNILENTFFDLWLSASSRKFRSRLARNDFNEWDLCIDCKYFDGANLPEGVLESYLKKSKVKSKIK